MKEQKTPIPTGPVELDLFADETHELPDVTPDAGLDAAAESTETPSVNTPAENTSKEDKNTSVAEQTPKKKKKKKKKNNNNAEAAKPKSFFSQIHDFINDEEERPININIRALLGGDGLPNIFRRNWVFISIIVFFTCCYVTCRYMMQSAVLEHDKLTDILIDRRYKNLTLDCELLEHTLSSHIEKSLKDSTIHVPTEQSFLLKTED